MKISNKEFEESFINRMEQIKKEIAISMYVFLIGIVIVGVNTALFPFPETILDYPLFDTSGLTFVIEVYIISFYFIFLLYRTKIDYMLHITYYLILMIYDMTIKRLKYRFNQIYPLDRLKNE